MWAREVKREGLGFEGGEVFAVLMGHGLLVVRICERGAVRRGRLSGR